MSQENNNDLQGFDDSSHYTRNHYQSAPLDHISISSAVGRLEAENRDLKLQVSKLREENRNLRSNEIPIDKQALSEQLQTIKSMVETCESILGIKVYPSMKPPIGYLPQGQAQNHLQMRPPNGESMMPAYSSFGAQSMLTTKPPTPERMVEETNGPPSPSNSHENSTSGNVTNEYANLNFMEQVDTEEQTNNYNNDKPNLQMSSLNGTNNNNRRPFNNYNNNGSSSSSSNNSNNNNTFKKKSAFTVWVAWRGRPSTDSQLRQIFSGLDIKDVRPSPNKSFAHIDFTTADSMNKALARNGEDIPNYGHLRVEKGNPHPRPTMGKNHSLPSSSSSPLSSSSLQSPNSPQSHSSPKQHSFSSPPPIPPHTPTPFSDNRQRQQNQQNRKNDYVRGGGYSNSFNNNRQNSSNINYTDEVDEQKALKGWNDMAAQGTTSITNHQEHKGNNGDM